MKIEGAVALVTGGAMGIGKEVVETLLQKGIKLCNILDLNEDTGCAVADAFNKAYGADKVNFIKCDVSSKDQLQDAFQKTHAVYGRLDIVCNNAGIEDQDDIEKVIHVNLIGSMHGTLLAKDIMMKQNKPPGGVIVNTASLAGLYPAFYSPTYCASKHGVVGFTRSLAQHPFITKSNIRLNLVCPAFVDTSMVTRARGIADPLLQAIVSKANIVPMSDVVKAFLMAIEDDSMNGQAIRVTPGGGVDLQKYETLDDIAKLKILSS